MQVELPHLLGRIPGQVIASTHSATLVSHIDHDAVRLLRPRAGGVEVMHLKAINEPKVSTEPDQRSKVRSTPPDLPRLRQPAHHDSEIEKVKRLVERPFGEVLFASAIVIGDGATERAFLPPLLRHALGALGHGVVVIDPESMAKADPLVKLAHAIDLPWYLFVDRDGEGTRAAASICSRFGSIDARGSQRQVFVHDSAGATEAMLLTHDETMCRRALTTLRPDLADSPESTMSLMTRVKGSAGNAYARQLIAAYGSWEHWPDGLRTLVQTLQTALEPEAAHANAR
jgi:predicted ATP-dependent endonuclease of OLD family